MTYVFDTHPPLIHVLISYVKEIVLKQVPTHLLDQCLKIHSFFLGLPLVLNFTFYHENIYSIFWF